MGIDIINLLLTLLNYAISFAFFVLAIIYFFVEARSGTRASTRRTLLLSTIITVASIVVSLMTRYIIVFPESKSYNFSSDFFMITNIINALLSFFALILYIRCGQHFAMQRGLPGSPYIMGERMFSNIDWKLIIIPMPLLFIWTYLVFECFPAEPTELAYALSPAHNDYKTLIYNILNAAVVAPLQEEIIYRQFAMGLFYKWFGRGKMAVACNILISSLIFALAHVGILTIDLIKILQILPLGIVFGLIYHKRGLGNAILSHSLFNSITVLIAFVADAIN